MIKAVNIFQINIKPTKQISNVFYQNRNLFEFIKNGELKNCEVFKKFKIENIDRTLMNHNIYILKDINDININKKNNFTYGFKKRKYKIKENINYINLLNIENIENLKEKQFNMIQRNFNTNSKLENKQNEGNKLNSKDKNDEIKNLNDNIFNNNEQNMNKSEIQLNQEIEKKKITKKEVFINKQYKEKLIKFYLILGLILIPCGYVFMSCIQQNLTLNDLIKIYKKKIETMENKYTDLMNEFIDKYFPLSNEPLLPDFNDLKYPENLPTLVIDLNYVIAKLEYDRKVGWRVLKRPYADLFFKELATFYELVIWSDDNFPVAQEVISKWGIPAIGCLHRDQCLRKKKKYVKDLRRLGRNLNRVIMIDHEPQSFMLQPNNAILIREFTGNINDKELLCLIDLLKSFAMSTNNAPDFLKKYGGGDYDIGRRYLRIKSDSEQKSNRIRNIGKIFNAENKKSPNKITFNS